MILILKRILFILLTPILTILLIIGFFLWILTWPIYWTITGKDEYEYGEIVCEYISKMYMFRKLNDLYEEINKDRL